MISGNGVIDKKLPFHFFYWDDWNPYQTTASLSSMPLWVKRTGWTGTASPTSGRKIGTNYYVRGSSCFLSTFSGSATSSFNVRDRSRNSATKIFSVELPMYINPYTQSTYSRDKVVILATVLLTMKIYQLCIDQIHLLLRYGEQLVWVRRVLI
jgi:hypothetical protein